MNNEINKNLKYKESRGIYNINKSNNNIYDFWHSPLTLRVRYIQYMLNSTSIT